jgi:hypothetical protein
MKLRFVVSSLISIGIAIVCVIWLARQACRVEMVNTPHRVNGNAHVVAGDMDETIPASALGPLMVRARLGDNAAANDLGNHFSSLGNDAEERRWRTLAANRGDCLSMALLKDLESRTGNQAAAAHWNMALRQNECTWQKAYGSTADPELNPMPLWNDSDGLPNP